MRRSSTLTSFVLVSFLTSQLCAWHDGGHQIVASIAFKRLTTQEQTKIANLLKNHPRFDDDFKPQMPSAIAAANKATQNEWIFMRAAIWPDVARKLPDPIKDDFHRPEWHF